MLFSHQAGVVKVGEVVRYTLTYVPSDDRILPTPGQLHIRIKNTSAVALRAAYLHGPYTLHVSAYPSNFNPNKKVEQPRRYGVPQFEPNLKAGGHWHAQLTVPDHLRQHGDKDESAESEADRSEDAQETPKEVTWIIEIASQILFSNTASVHYELLIGRDERSLDLGFAAIASMGHGEPGRISDARAGSNDVNALSYQTKGVYSKSVRLAVEDTAALWDKPRLPRRAPAANQRPTSSLKRSFSKKDREDYPQSEDRKERKLKRIHLVILTHGLHSNLGADMLYLKESIDAAAKDARREIRERKSRQRQKMHSATFKQPRSSEDEGSSAHSDEARTSIPQPQEDIQENQEEASEDEEVLVRGFPGNAVRTEKGIQYLGKRLAKYILTLTYPDQPYLPPSKSLTRSLSGFGPPGNKSQGPHFQPFGHGDQRKSSAELPYTFTRISFIGHSLGGLVQTYAMAYIHKHSPGFFDQIRPENFICLAAPLLGLSNENPLYVKFALDFGLVGRTGQDLGLTWRAPNIARTGWSVMVAGFGSNGADEKTKQQDPRSKPLLRILPSGPAHHVLRMFRNRTVYSNVVNDGIVPLRTSCLLFLDWRGLDRVENARRENGLIGTMASFGWAELTGANTTSHRPHSGRSSRKSSEDSGRSLSKARTADSPEPKQDRALSESPVPDDGSTTPSNPEPHQFLSKGQSTEPHEVPRAEHAVNSTESSKATDQQNSPFGDFFNFFRAGAARQQPVKPQKVSQKAQRTYTRAQIVANSPDVSSKPHSPTGNGLESKRPSATRGDSLISDPKSVPPPKTSIFEAAGDILNPPLPTQAWITDPSTRSRTIFHDRVYHPEDIPPEPQRRGLLGRSFSSDSRIKSAAQPSTRQDSFNDGTGMKVEERIARAYHRDLSWRKVLVRLEPDAHNNMIVRRMFANAYGWDVVKHICDTHFSNSFAATTYDDEEPAEERAHALNKPVSKEGEQVKGQTDAAKPRRATTKSEVMESSDVLAELDKPQHGTANMASGGSVSSMTGSQSSKRRQLTPRDSVEWSDSVFEGSEDDADTEDEARSPLQTWQKFWGSSPKNKATHQRARSQSEQLKPLKISVGEPGNEVGKASEHGAGTSDAEIAEFLTKSPSKIEGHRGLGITDTSTLPDTGEAQPLNTASPKSPASAPAPGECASPGLHKPVEAHLSPSASEDNRKEPEGMSLTERVARLNMEKEG